MKVKVIASFVGKNRDFRVWLAAPEAGAGPPR